MYALNQRAKVAVTVLTGITTSIGWAVVGRRLLSKFVERHPAVSQEIAEIVEKMVVRTADSEEQSTALVNAILLEVKQQPLLGFDCEWVQNSKRRPVALLQLASRSGLCAIFQLCLLAQIPPSLKELLEDETIIKVGVDPITDANHLCADYSISVRGTFDIRHLSDYFPKMGLAAIVQRELGISLHKPKHLRTSNWEQSRLSREQLQYAAMDALSSALAFNELINKKIRFPFFASEANCWNLIMKECTPMLDQRYREKHQNPAISHSRHSSSPLQRKESGQPNGTTLDCNGKNSFRAFSFRKAPLYHNCLLLAPDGEVLCTCDVKKANWYVSKKLASIESTDPLKVRLLFEPSGRASGVSGQYYIQEKENQCVVCGRRDSYLRKKVVPHEYRKYFPDSMKNHQSHDVLLLCASCHLKSNSSDLEMRTKLGELCNAPLNAEDNVKVTEDRKRKQLRSAARALLQVGGKLPADRQEELHNIILESYPEVTPELLNELKDLDISVHNSDYSPHGLSVVEYFAKEVGDGLKSLEKMWREHFLQTMKPKFLPPFWSIDHNHENESRYHLPDSFLANVKSTAV